MEVADLQGYNTSIEATRHVDFSRLTGITYLDHAGATLYADSQLEMVHRDLLNNMYGNPHSSCASSQLTSDTVEQVRFRILQHFQTSSDDHSVIFTSGCTGALKLLADNFDWSALNDSHSKNEGLNRRPKVKESNSRQIASVSALDVQHQLSRGNPDCAVPEKPENRPNNSSISPETVTRSTHDVCPTEPPDEKHFAGSPHVEELQILHSNQDLSHNAVPKKAGCFCYLMDNHTSVVGMREIASSKGAEILCVTYEDIKNEKAVPFTVDEVNSNQRSGREQNCRAGNCLFTYPAQSNFSGAKYPLDLGSSLVNLPSCRADTWAVALDAASLVSTSPLDLSMCAADFVAVSFYKMFGFPTGLGALIVRRHAESLLRTSYFGGGTVQAYLARSQFSVPKPGLSERFEDGTLPFLDIIALKHGFDTIERIAGSMHSIADHTFALTRYVHHKLVSYRHGNGTAVAKLYCDSDFKRKDQQGPIINFNILQPSREYVGYAQVERIASLHGIHLRTGCFCNTGACQRHVGLTDEQIIHNYQAGHVCGDAMDLIDGRPTGSVRISFGYMSTLSDADVFLRFIEDCFIEEATTDEEMFNSADRCAFVEVSGSLPRTQERALHDPSAIPTRITLTNIFLYPVKSCGAFEVGEWELDPTGLLYDRHWMVVNDNGVCLSQKREERLCLIKPSIDLEDRCLRLSCRGCDDIRVPLEVGSETAQSMGSFNQSKVCMDRVKTFDCGDIVADWLSAVLGRKCRLLQQNPVSERSCKLASGSHRSHRLSLVNESPLTLLGRSSGRALLRSIHSRNRTTTANQSSDPPGPITAPALRSESNDWSQVGLDELIGRFRGNLVMDGPAAFEEEEWAKIQIGDHVFIVGGVCTRCQMVCVDQESAVRNKEPLLTLSSIRGRKVPFGVHLLGDMLPAQGEVLVRVGDAVSVLQRQSLTTKQGR